MNPREDLQYLIPETAREHLIVLPKKSIQYATVSISTLTFGIGIAIGTLAMGSTTGAIALVVCFILSRVLGYYINQYEAMVVRRFDCGPTETLAHLMHQRSKTEADQNIPPNA